MSERIVIESPLSGDFKRNFRYLLWCCRAVWRIDGIHAIASHMLNPWYMDDHDPKEREAGIDNAWVWHDRDVEHWFFEDMGVSRGMSLAGQRCDEGLIRCRRWLLSEYDPDAWASFERGEWPPHTKGFELA